jgi:hypothetical protein
MGNYKQRINYSSPNWRTYNHGICPAIPLISDCHAMPYVCVVTPSYDTLNGSTSDSATQMESLRRSLKKAEARRDLFRKDSLSARTLVVTISPAATDTYAPYVNDAQ